MGRGRLSKQGCGVGGGEELKRGCGKEGENEVVVVLLRDRECRG